MELRFDVKALLWILAGGYFWGMVSLPLAWSEAEDASASASATAEEQVRREVEREKIFQSMKSLAGNLGEIPSVPKMNAVIMLPEPHEVSKSKTSETNESSERRRK